jgi:hypothetical protein
MIFLLRPSSAGGEILNSTANLVNPFIKGDKKEPEIPVASAGANNIRPSLCSAAAQKGEYYSPLRTQQRRQRQQ